MPLEWLFTLLLIFGSLAILMMSGLLVTIAFMLINLVGVYLLWGGGSGLEQLIYSLGGSVSTFALVAIPLFVIMGEVMFHSGVAPNMLDALDKLLGRLPGSPDGPSDALSNPAIETVNTLPFIHPEPNTVEFVFSLFTSNEHQSQF